MEDVPNTQWKVGMTSHLLQAGHACMLKKRFFTGLGAYRYGTEIISQNFIILKTNFYDLYELLPEHKVIQFKNCRIFLNGCGILSNEFALICQSIRIIRFLMGNFFNLWRSPTGREAEVEDDPGGGSEDSQPSALKFTGFHNYYVPR